MIECDRGGRIHLSQVIHNVAAVKGFHAQQSKVNALGTQGYRSSLSVRGSQTHSFVQKHTKFRDDKKYLT